MTTDRFRDLLAKIDLALNANRAPRDGRKLKFVKLLQLFLSLDPDAAYLGRDGDGDDAIYEAACQARVEPPKTRDTKWTSGSPGDQLLPGRSLGCPFVAV